MKLRSPVGATQFVALAVFTLETDYPSEMDNQSSKSFKIDRKTDG